MTTVLSPPTFRIDSLGSWFILAKFQVPVVASEALNLCNETPENCLHLNNRCNKLVI